MIRTIPAPLTWFIFPILLAGSLGIVWGLLSGGVAPPAAAAAAMLATLGSLVVTERLWPLHPAWNRRPDGIDVGLLVVNRLVDAALVVISVMLAGLLAEAFAPGPWPRHWPAPAQVLLGLGLAEAIRYAVHRASHRPGFLWRVHTTHHRPRRMYSLNGPRLHPANYAWAAGAHTAPMLLMGADLPIVALVIHVTGFFVVFQHANVRLRFDGLNRFFATPDVHRLHHLRDGGARDVNFAIVLIVFDRLLGTYAPAGSPVAADAIGLRSGGDGGPGLATASIAGGAARAVR